MSNEKTLPGRDDAGPDMILHVGTFVSLKGSDRRYVVAKAPGNGEDGEMVSVFGSIDTISLSDLPGDGTRLSHYPRLEECPQQWDSKSLYYINSPVLDRSRENLRRIRLSDVLDARILGDRRAGVVSFEKVPGRGYARLDVQCALGAGPRAFIMPCNDISELTAFDCYGIQRVLDHIGSHVSDARASMRLELGKNYLSDAKVPYQVIDVSARGHGAFSVVAINRDNGKIARYTSSADPYDDASPPLTREAPTVFPQFLFAAQEGKLAQITEAADIDKAFSGDIPVFVTEGEIPAKRLTLDEAKEILERLSDEY